MHTTTSLCNLFKVKETEIHCICHIQVDFGARFPQTHCPLSSGLQPQVLRGFIPVEEVQVPSHFQAGSIFQNIAPSWSLYLTISNPCPYRAVPLHHLRPMSSCPLLLLYPPRSQPPRLLHPSRVLPIPGPCPFQAPVKLPPYHLGSCNLPDPFH